MTRRHETALDMLGKATQTRADLQRLVDKRAPQRGSQLAELKQFQALR